MSFAVTAALADDIAHIRENPPSRSGLERAQAAFLDTIGVMIAGGSEPAVALLADTLMKLGENPHGQSAGLLLDATAAHVLDFDDVAFGGHVSAILVPSILRAATGRGVSGIDMLLAYAAGYEAWSEIASREKVMYHARGLHPTGLLGPIASAAACSVLFRLDTCQTSMALAIAASQGAGLTASFGTMTKPFHAGRAAQAGFLAACLAQNGFTAAPDGLESFLSSYSPGGDIDRERPLNRVSGAWMLERIPPSVKQYPVCYAGHRAIDASIELAQIHPLSLTDIVSIDVLISDRHSKTLRYSKPKTASEARFSLEFFVASALSHNWVGLSDVDDANLTDETLQQLMAKITRRISEDMDPVLDGFARYDQVAVCLSDGQRLISAPVSRALGHAERPLDLAHIRTKFEDCLAYAGRSSDAEALFSAVATLADSTEGTLLSAPWVTGRGV